MQRFSRRRLLQSGLLLSVGLAGCTLPGETDREGETGADGGTASDSTTDSAGGVTDRSDLELDVETLASGFTSPVGVSVPQPDDAYVVDQPGQLYRVSDGGYPEVVLDIRDRVVDVSGYDERGLLGVAFHPGFDGSGRVFLRYSAPRREGTPDSYSHTSVLSSFRVKDGSFEPDSERAVLEIPQPQANHNAGSIAFGPDGYLYRRSRPSASGLDPEGEGRTLIRQSTVSTDTVATWVKDLNLKQLPAVARKCDTSQHPATAGETGVVGRGGAADPHGRTGRSGVNSSRPISGRSRGIKFACDSTARFGTCGQDGEAAGLVPAVLHNGEAVPALQDRYVFADWQANGRLFVASERDTGLWPVTAVPIAGDAVGSNVLSFGRTTAGELLVCTSDSGGISNSSGAVHRLQ